MFFRKPCQVIPGENKCAFCKFHIAAAMYGYRDAVDVAITSVQAGVTDYNSAIRRTMKTAAQDGLRVKYPNSGLTRRLDSAVRQNVLDGVRAVNNDVLRQLGNEYGADGVEISAHALCATDHLRRTDRSKQSM